MKKKEFSKIPALIKVDVRKGTSGVLLAKLPEYSIFTEADSLNELIFQVNDLIYTYFNIPKKYQNEILFVPPREIQLDLIKIASESTTKSFSQFKMRSLYSPEFLEIVKRMNYT